MHPQDYAQILYEALGDKSHENQVRIIERFKSILIQNKETHLAKAIFKEFKKIQTKNLEERTAYITSATELSSKQQQELENMLPEPRVFSENPSLLGGVAVRQKNTLYNATLKKKLETLKSSL